MQLAEENNITSELTAVSARPEIGHDRKVHDLFTIILGEVSDLQSGGQSFNGKLIDLEQQKYLQQFKGWCMPSERHGYIKARAFDFL